MKTLQEKAVITMKNEISITEWIKNFNSRKYDKRDVQTQIEAGWYDWFCKDNSLINKTTKMGNIISKIKEGGKIDLENSYLWFKNNCPLNGPIYDDFRISDIHTNETLMVIQIDNQYYMHKVTVFEKHNGFSTPTFQSNSFSDLTKWLSSHK